MPSNFREVRHTEFTSHNATAQLHPAALDPFGGCVDQAKLLSGRGSAWYEFYSAALSSSSLPSAPVVGSAADRVVGIGAITRSKIHRSARPVCCRRDPTVVRRR